MLPASCWPRVSTPKVTLVTRHAASEWHSGKTCAMISTVGEAAKWTVQEIEKTGPRFVHWMPFPGARGEPPVRLGELPVPEHYARCRGPDSSGIVCNGGIQWIVQSRRGSQWLGESFCHTKEALLRCSGHPNHPVLLALPERIVERTAKVDQSAAAPGAETDTD
jgi:hypothetical protein